MIKRGIGFVLVLCLTSSVWAGPAGTEISRMEEQIAALTAAVTALQADVAALTARVTALEGGAPATYLLTTTTAGTGQGIAAPGGARTRRVRSTQAQYAAGAPVTLTAVSNPGSTFAGWSPAPCAPAFPMPPNALTCTATFTAITPPPVTGTDWQRLPTGQDAIGTFSFTITVWDSQRQQVLAVGWEHEPWCLTPTTNAWARCGTKGPHNDFHNAGYAYDPVNDRWWVSTPYNEMAYWQRATGAYVIHAPGGCGMDPAMLFDPPRQRFICFGGWSTPVGTPHIATFALTPPATAWTGHAPATGPLFDTSDAAKMTFTRAGWDAKRSRIWYVDEFLDLWALDPATLTWTTHGTIGTKPDRYSVFARHEVADTIVAWTGQAEIAGGTTAPVIRKTYRLDLATMTWAEVATATVPSSRPVSDNSLLYDPVTGRILLHTGVNFGRETWALTLGTTTPPPTTSYLLSLTLAGTGSGVATGGGTYPVGTVVPLTATPATGSTFVGWSGDPDCADGSVTMTGSKTCTATFVLSTTTPPPTSGPCLPTAKQVFTPCEVPATLDTTPFASGSKDLMWTWDSKRKKLYLGLGDENNSYANGSGNHVVWSYDASTNGWAVPATFCGAPGTVSPNHPTDYGIMVYDPGRDRVWWLGQGDGFPPGQEGTTCYQGAPGWPTGSIRRNGFLSLHPDTNTWSKLSEQATNSTGGAYYDQPADRILNLEAPGVVQAWAMTTMPAVKTTIADFSNLQPEPKWTGSTGGWGWAEYPDRTKWAFDPVGRIAYIPIVVRRFDVSGLSVENGVWMVMVNTVTGAVALKARAPLPAGMYVAPYFIMSVWDSTNQAVIFPAMSDSCGQIKAMLVYHPTTDTWESTPVPANTHGATVAYDPLRNVVLLGGREFCEGQTPNPPRLYLWRYGP